MLMTGAYMISEAGLLTLVSEGENESVDFKREINIDDAPKKAEFVKDVIAIANSCIGVGYLLVGIEDDKTIVGTSPLQEERIQQITRTYITPSVSISCIGITVSSVGLLVVAIAIKGHERPHKVARAIERINQDEVFIRQGTVVLRASPEEILRMANERFTEDARILKKATKLITAANYFLQINSIKNAIEYYSLAIELDRASNTFIRRGIAYVELIKSIDTTIHKKYEYMDMLLENDTTPDEVYDAIHKEIETLRQRKSDYTILAINDLSEAVALSSNINEQKYARLERVNIIREHFFYHYEHLLDEDFKWLQENSTGIEKANYIMMELRKMQYHDEFFIDDTEYALKLIEEAMGLGFSSGEVYAMRSRVHFWENNFGLALKDIKKAILLTNDSEYKFKYIKLEAVILHKMQRYDELYAFCKQVDTAFPMTEYGPCIQLTDDINDDILTWCAIDLAFGCLDRQQDDRIYQTLKYWFPRQRHFKSNYPKLAGIIQQYLQYKSKQP